jgi:guanine deaminase
MVALLNCANLQPMKAYRAAILRFAADHAAVYETDGLLVVAADASGRQRVEAVGSWRVLAPRYAHLNIAHWPGRIIAPGFVDMHLHYPQVDVIGSPADGLLPWLENYTFPQETRFSEPAHAAEVARFFIDELLRNGVTTALTFATSHPSSVNALFEEAEKRQLRLITGKCLMDRNSPDGVRDETEQSLIDTEALIQRWHGQDRVAATRSCVARVRWRPNTRTFGCSRMWLKTAKKSLGFDRCTLRRAATWRCMRNSVCYGRAAFTHTAFTLTTTTTAR